MDSIRLAGETLGHSAPILISSGCGVFLAQRYLESWAASGMLVLNPSSPDCSSAVARWLGLDVDALESMSQDDYDSVVAKSFPATPTAEEAFDEAAHFAASWLLRSTADPQSLATLAASYQ